MTMTSVQAFELLNELVLDAGETVSYRRLASALCLHVNQSKQLLQQFVDKHQKTSVLHVSMLLCGSNSNGNVSTLLCPREELKSVQDSFNTVLYKHIYAVSLASASLEKTALVNTLAGFDDLTETIGIICSKQCTKLSQEEIGNLKSNSYKTLSQNPTSITLQNNTTSKPLQNNTTSKILQNNITEKPILNINNDKKRDTKINCNTSDEVVKVKEETCESITTSKNIKKDKVQSKNISNFFSKANGNQITQNNKKVAGEQQEIKCQEIVENSFVEDSKQKELSPEKNRAKSLKETSDMLASRVKEQKLEAPQKKCKQEETQKLQKEITKDSKTKEKTVKKSKTVNVKNGKVDKKRKRVLQISDSEDSDKDDPFEEAHLTDVKIESDEDIIPPTPNADVVKITSGIVNPRKRRKIVDKTYITDDGYMVTKKEEVLESCSEEEAELKENIVQKNVTTEFVVGKKAPALKTKKKMASPQKGKQASIMNFFKKK